MEDFVVVLLVIAVFWLLVKQAGRSEERQKVSELNDLVARLERRLAKVEEGLRAGVAATPPAGERSTEQPAEVVIRPRPMSPVVGAPAPAAKVEVPPVASFMYTPPVVEKPEASVAATPAAHMFSKAPAEKTVAARSMSIEERLGQNWLNKLGVVALDAAATANEGGLPHEVVLMDLHVGLRALDSLTGATTSDDILGRIFSTFCIGK